MTRALKVGISVAEVATVDLIVPSVNGSGEAVVALRRVLADFGLGVVWRLKTKHGINERQHEYLHQQRSWRWRYLFLEASNIDSLKSGHLTSFALYIFISYVIVHRTTSY